MTRNEIKLAKLQGEQERLRGLLNYEFKGRGFHRAMIGEYALAGECDRFVRGRIRGHIKALRAIKREIVAIKREAGKTPTLFDV